MAFELSEYKKMIGNREFRRVRSLSNTPDRKKGELGGWVETCCSLDPYAWVHPGACVYREATILGGDIYGGTFRGGVVHGGEFFGGVIHGGKFFRGEFFGGEFFGGIYQGGCFYDGTFYHGHFSGGRVLGGSIYGGTIYEGELTERNHLCLTGVGSEGPCLFIYVHNREIRATFGQFIGKWSDLMQTDDPALAKTFRVLDPVVQLKLAPLAARGWTE